MQRVPAANFVSGTGTQYFTGLVNGQPTWSASESDSVPVVQDNPLNGAAWPNDAPTIGNISVVYSTDLNLWLMTYDGGRGTTAPNKTRGSYFSYAAQPWGTWVAAQLMFQEMRDGAYGLGGFVHSPGANPPDPPGDGLNGPTIGSNNIYRTSGGLFAPLMIERFLTVSGNTLKVYWTGSTWNPYVVVRMRSEFAITPAGSNLQSACDVNQDGNVNVSDVQLIINQALGLIVRANDLNEDGAVNVADIQIVVNAALSLGCKVA
jgi:hypothetical protein